MEDGDRGALAGVRVVTLAVNLPGPLACARMRALGAEVTKVEPPSGDPLRLFSPAWYDELAAGQDVASIDLKTDDGLARLHDLLASADVLVTATRPAGLARLGLAWNELHARHPRLCHVAITGHAPPDEDRPGHDLTYAACAGLIAPPELPRTLAVDLASADQAVSAALALLLARARDGAGRRTVVALAEVANGLAAPLRHGLTAPGALLGGGSAVYGVYAAAQGWVAVAALEPAFVARLGAALGIDPLDRDALAAALRARTAEEWEAWAREHDLPLAAVRGAP